MYEVRPKYSSSSYPKWVDGDPDTYELIKRDTTGYERIRLYGFDFSVVPRDERITHFKIRAIIRPDSKYAVGRSFDKIRIRDRYSYGTSFYHTSDAFALFTSDIDYDKPQLHYAYLSNTSYPKTEIFDYGAADYFNQNRDVLYALIDNDNYKTANGFFLEGNPCWGFYGYDIVVEVYTEDTTKIFNGENAVTSAYLSTQSISSIYLGNDKLL